MSLSVREILESVVLCSMILLVGCDEHAGREKKLKDKNELAEAIWVDAHPVVGRVYHLTNPDLMDGVRSTREKNLYYIPSDPDVSVAVLINSTADYSDGELLKRGEYRYEGNKTCEIEDAVEINNEVKMVLRNVKCRNFVEIQPTRLTVPQKRSL